MSIDFNKLFTEVGNYISSERGQQIISAGSGIIENQGDENYVKAVLTARTLGEFTGTQPTVERFENNRYKIAWYGTELEKIQKFVEDTSEDALFSKGEPSPIVVDYFPVVKPMAIKYALPALIGSGVVCGLIGYVIAKA